MQITSLTVVYGGMALVLLRLAYLTVTNLSATRRMLPMSDRDKDAEILACGTNSPSSNGNSEKNR
ncbi:hypothetical protein ACIREE_39350 [Streptomyces sp. NPDC102467]|uniref:hypothetical protein n=1 Tax=Streptomyces sp. NPDC102467 TaxID=3366179 RepID=UPI00381B03C7